MDSLPLGTEVRILDKDDMEGSIAGNFIGEIVTIKSKEFNGYWVSILNKDKSTTEFWISNEWASLV